MMVGVVGKSAASRPLIELGINFKPFKCSEGHIIGLEAIKLARMRVEENQPWQRLIDEAIQKHDQMKLDDVASFLHALLKVKKSSNSLLKTFSPQICMRAKFLTSSYIATVLEAYSQAKEFDVNVYMALRNQLSFRMYEFDNMGLLCRVCKSIAAFKESDPVFIKALAEQAVGVMLHAKIPPFQLGEMLDSFCKMGYNDLHLYELCADLAVKIVGHSTSSECMQMLRAFVSKGIYRQDIQWLCVRHLLHAIKFLDRKNQVGVLVGIFALYPHLFYNVHAPHYGVASHLIKF